MDAQARPAGGEAAARFSGFHLKPAGLPVVPAMAAACLTLREALPSHSAVQLSDVPTLPAKQKPLPADVPIDPGKSTSEQTVEARNISK